ncbi:hypothetical protein KKF84_13695 [Myxococcota bacterium]|nr:hypothetical protein [Myxococcota bacterium]MBU1536374.1 hypothetical protein [Myxococcota bacterium]
MEQTRIELLALIESLKIQQERTAGKLKFLQEEIPKMREEIEQLKNLLAASPDPGATNGSNVQTIQTPR